MLFEKGRAKTGGRAKGTPNVATRIEDALKGTNINIWETFSDDWLELDPWQRMQVRKWLSDFLYSKPKHLDDQEDLPSNEEEVRQLAEKLKEVRNDKP